MKTIILDLEFKIIELIGFEHILNNAVKIKKLKKAISILKEFESLSIKYTNINSITDILDSYNNFLLENQYVDTDIINEEPTALDQFLILNK